MSQIGPLVQKLWLKNSENLQIYTYRVPGAITRVPGTRISLITRAGTRDPSQAYYQHTEPFVASAWTADCDPDTRKFIDYIDLRDLCDAA